GSIAGLTSQTRSPTTWQHRRVKAPAERNRLDDVLNGSGDDHANRRLPVVGGVSRIQSPAARVKTHLTTDAAAQRIGQSAMIRRNARRSPRRVMHGKVLSHSWRLR